MEKKDVNSQIQIELDGKTLNARIFKYEWAHSIVVLELEDARHIRVTAATGHYDGGRLSIESLFNLQNNLQKLD